MTPSFLPLGSELVLTCRVCGAQSTDSVYGADGWTVSKALPWSNVLFDLCPCCTPKKRRVRR